MFFLIQLLSTSEVNNFNKEKEQGRSTDMYSLKVTIPIFVLVWQILCYTNATKNSGNCFENGFDHPGNDIGGITKTSAADCQIACQNNVQCVWFTFDGTTNLCWLKTKSGTKVPHSNDISGPKFCPGSCYEVGIDHPGNDIAGISKSSVTNCQIACQSNAKCVWFTYDVVTSLCWLKTSIGTMVQKSVDISGPKFCPGSCFQSGFDYPGNDIAGISQASVNDCQITCQSNAQCVWFTFDVVTSLCWLKSSIGSIVQKSIDISGPKFCPGSCFEPGFDSPGNDIAGISQASVSDCQIACQNNVKCVRFTFDTVTSLCWLKSSIGAKVPKAIDISGPKFCPGSCFVPGFDYPGNDIYGVQLTSASDCQNACQNNGQCVWFTFDVATNLCWLKTRMGTKVVKTVDISGPKFCPVYTKIAVAIGINGGALDDVEVIDLSSASTRCQNLPTFPNKNYGASGGLGFNDVPIICGGTYQSSSCYSLINRSWQAVQSMNTERGYFGMTKSPFLTDASKLFITGGSSSTKPEKLLGNGWQYSTAMPVAINQHCMAMINSTSIIVIGGYQDTSSPSSKTYIFNTVTNSWSTGPSLNQARRLHSCAAVNMNSKSQTKSIVVVGGYSSAVLKSTEVWDPNTFVWRIGPDLPQPIMVGSMVELPDGSAVLVGGTPDVRTFTNTIYKLANAAAGSKWQLMSQRLSLARAYHTAFLIPDQLTTCK